MMKDKNVKIIWAYAALIFVVLMWSFMPIICNLKMVKDNYSPGMFTALRALFASLALAVINWKNLKNINREYFKYALPSGLSLASATLCQMVGYRCGAGPAVSAILENLSLIIIPILLFCCTKKAPTWTKIFAAAVCFIGSAIIALGDAGGDLFSVSLGVWLAALAGILYGVNFVITGVYAKKLDSGLFVFIQLSIQALLAFFYAIFGEMIWGTGETTFLFTFDVGALLVIAFVGVVATGICWTLRAYCMKTIPVMIVAVIMPFATVLTSVWSIVGGMEKPTWNFFVGGCIVIAAIFIAQLGDGWKKDKAKQTTPPEKVDEEENNC